MALREAARGGVSMGHGGGATSAIRRIQRELKEICESPSRHWTAGPVCDDLFEWQFVVRGPPGTEFEGGIYTGRIVLPVNYPLAPPSITLLTPNGRWEVGKKICLSNTSYHPDLWQPAWGIRTMMEALRSHFPMPGDGAIGAIDWPAEIRRRLAKESLDFICAPGTRRNRELLPELSPEELREDQPEPLPPQLQALRTPAASPEGSEAAVASTAEAGNAGSEGLPEGLRQRRPAEAVPASSGAAVGGSAGSSGLASEADNAGSSASGAAPAAPRRRREGSRQQRRQQPVLIQLLKPPQTSRGWVLLAINVFIGLLLVSFAAVLIDLIKNPPQILDVAPDMKESKD